jgi:hypothetical protein
MLHLLGMLRQFDGISYGISTIFSQGPDPSRRPLAGVLTINTMAWCGIDVGGLTLCKSRLYNGQNEHQSVYIRAASGFIVPPHSKLNFHLLVHEHDMLPTVECNKACGTSACIEIHQVERQSIERVPFALGLCCWVASVVHHQEFPQPAHYYKPHVPSIFRELHYSQM